ncbi:hypothetical protein D3C76_825210 [compost metagenome]
MGEVRNPKTVTERKAITAVQPLPQHDPSISISIVIVNAVLSMCIEGKGLCAVCAPSGSSKKRLPEAGQARLNTYPQISIEGLPLCCANSHWR